MKGSLTYSLEWSWYDFDVRYSKFKKNFFSIAIWFLSNTVSLCTTTTRGTPNLLLLLTSGRCSEVGLCNKDSNWDSKVMVAVDRCSLDAELVVSSSSAVLFKNDYYSNRKKQNFVVVLDREKDIGNDFRFENCTFA